MFNLVVITDYFIEPQSSCAAGRKKLNLFKKQAATVTNRAANGCLYKTRR